MLEIAVDNRRANQLYCAVAGVVLDSVGLRVDHHIVPTPGRNSGGVVQI